MLRNSVRLSAIRINPAQRYAYSTLGDKAKKVGDAISEGLGKAKESVNKGTADANAKIDDLKEHAKDKLHEGARKVKKDTE